MVHIEAFHAILQHRQNAALQVQCPDWLVRVRTQFVDHAIVEAEPECETLKIGLEFRSCTIRKLSVICIAIMADASVQNPQVALARAGEIYE